MRLAKDSNGQVFILDGSSITLALRDSYGGSPSLGLDALYTVLGVLLGWQHQ